MEKNLKHSDLGFKSKYVLGYFDIYILKNLRANC